MGKTSLLLWAVFLAIPGILGSWSVHTHKTNQRQQQMLLRQEVREGTQAYLRSYQDWNQLTAEQKAETPWGTQQYGGAEIQRQLEHDQVKRLAADLEDIAHGINNVPEELADVLYGSGWVQKATDYKKSVEIRELVLMISLVCCVIGALFFAAYLVLQTAGLFKKGKKTTPNKIIKAPSAAPKSDSTASPAPQPVVSEVLPKAAKPLVEKKQSVANAAPTEPAGQYESFRQNRKVSNAMSVSALNEYAGLSVSAMPFECEPAAKTMMSPEPVLSSLNELSEEVSAIRQFAALQQDQMKKLQDGYDLVIIRRLCMRFIRCIDNISDRIERISRDGGDIDMIETIRDELVIALESSGIEQYLPDVDAPYKGLEKYAEAVSQREPNDQPQRSGTIARIMRPGYQYLVSDDDVKIIRCAQVRLYA